jgi:hypothetical protein
VKTDKYCRTNVNFRFLSYREHPFVLARDVTQVFYVKEPDPANKEEHHIVPKGKGNFFGVEDVVDEEGTTSLTLCLHLVKISLSLQLMTPRNLHTYIVISTKLSLLVEAI